MKRSILLLTLLLAAPLSAQLFIEHPPDSTVANLPVCDSGRDGRIMTVTDGVTATDCTTGGSVATVLCLCDGTAWSAIQGGGGGGGTPGGSDTEVQYNAAGGFGGTSGLTWTSATGTLSLAAGTQLEGAIITAGNPPFVTEPGTGFGSLTTGSVTLYLDSATGFTFYQGGDETSIFWDTGAPTGIITFDQSRNAFEFGSLVYSQELYGLQLGVGSLSAASAACLTRDAAQDRIYHDTNCDFTKDAGEVFIDQSGSGPTVREVDLNPSIPAVVLLEFDQSDGFRLADLTGGQVQIEIDQASPVGRGTVQLATHGESTPGEVVQSSDPRLSSTPGGSASGDLYGSYPNPSVGRLQNRLLTGTPADGEVYTWEATNSRWNTNPIDGGDAGSGTTRPSRGVTIQLLRHDTDCTSLTIGKAGEMCYEEDANALYVCEPTAGDCDTAGEWINLVP